MSMEKNLNNFIDELIQEIEKELDEATTTANVAGYNVPGAFSDGGAKDKKRKKKISTQFGMKIVGKIDESKFAKKPEVTPKQLLKIQNDVRKVNRKIKVYISKHPVTKGRLEIELGHGHDNDAEIDKIYGILKKHTGSWRTGTMFNESVNEDSDSEIKKSIKKNSKGGPYSVVVQKGNMSKHISHAKDVGNDINKVIKVYNQFKKKHRAGVQIIDGYGKTVFFESVNEAKVKRPVNRWLELKNDETMHPHKKMAMGLKELKYQLRETEKFFNWYNKIKTMNELDSDKYWKRTNRHIYTIKEKLINIAKTIQEIEK